jgi:hypothetical protein
MAQAQNKWYVKANENSNGHGHDWNNASNNLQAMIDSAAKAGNNDTVFVAAGDYTAPSDSSFTLKEGVKIYGGFNSTNPENSIDKRSFNRDSGVLLTKNTSKLIGNGNKSVVTGSGEYPITNATVLDGFTITGGKGSGGSTQNKGGGIYLNNASPKLTHLKISQNTANAGGGIYNENNCSPILTNVLISGNKATGSNTSNGGGILNNGSSPILTNVRIFGNTATGQNGGGGICNSDLSSPWLTNVLISGNTAYYGGGIAYYMGLSASVLTNVTVAGNYADYDGGIYFLNSSSSSGSVVYNSIIYGNISNNGNSGNNVTNMSCASYSYSIVGGATLNSTDHIDTSNPAFEKLVTISSINAATTDGDYRLTQLANRIDVTIL